MNKQKGRGVFIFLCLLPATLLLLLFIVYPTFQVFRTALYDKPNFVAEETLIGLKYFKQLFTERKLNFVGALQNTIVYVVFITLVTVVIAVFFANILMREKVKGKSLFRVIFYIPNILSLVVVAGIFSAIYTPNGLLNAILRGLGLTGLAQTKWLGDAKVVNWSIMFALIWQAIGYYMVMYMSSMSAIPEQLYEAANLEGATRWQQFSQITLPLIWNNIRTTLTFFIISTINLSFMFVQLTTEGNLGSESVLNYMYKKAYGGFYSYGMAIGACIFIFSFALSAIVNKITERDIIQF